MRLKAESLTKIQSRLKDWEWDIWEENHKVWSKKEWIQFESTMKIVRKIISERVDIRDNIG